MPPSNNGNKVSRFWNKYKKSFHWQLATLLTIVAFFILLIYFKFPEHEEALKFVTAVIVAFSGVFSAIYVGKGLSNRIHFDKVKNSLAFCDFFNSHEYNGLREICKTEYNSRTHSPVDLVQKVKLNTEHYYMLKAILNKIEDMSIAIQRNYVDEKVLYWSLDLIVDFHVTNFSPLIDEAVEENEETYMEMIKLHSSWSNDTYLSTGKPVKDDSNLGD